ncbi:MAG TPA: ATP-dependent zinc metalloprotease FtsH [Dehalococcoidia bacterium]|nr:ATP-dependent zinc metalloprotease FtsH [Dehalococcoidia bacterium]
MYGRWARNSFIYLLILVAIIAIVYSFIPSGSSHTQDVPLSTLISDAKAQSVKQVTVDGRKVEWTVANSDQKFKATLEQNDTVRQVLQDNGIPVQDQPQIETKQASAWGSVFSILLNFLPLIFIVAILFFFLRQAQGTNNQAMNFGKSRARMLSSSRPTVTFQDVAGVDEAKEELQEVVEFLKYPEKFAALGARIPKGVLLVGPPGTGKTLLAKAVAGEAGVPFFSISGSEFVEMFVGVGASRVRDLFDQAKRNSPCIVFVDEIDAVGRHRGAGLGGSHDEREQTLNQILVEMDGFDTSTNVIVVAATNRPDILDPALLRPGRFDRQVVLDRPDIRGRTAILNVHSKGKPLDTSIKLEVLAKQTPGFSGADLANLVNEAAILAARRGKKKVTMSEFDEAVDRVIAGPERKSRVISAREREIIAYHEAGHALMGHLLPGADPPYKISIVSRGMAGGFTRFLPEEDRHLYNKSQFHDMLAAMLGGLVSEEIAFGESTTGPQDDLERATRIARQMVTQWGMSERLGPRTFGRKEEMIFLGREISEQRNYSEKVAEEIDDEVRQIIDKAYHTARKLLLDNRPKLDQVVRAILEHETIEGENLAELLRRDPGDDIPEPSTPPSPSQPPVGSGERRETPPAGPVIQPHPGLAFDNTLPDRDLRS